GTIVQDLANASRGTFYLADLAPLPDGDDPDLEKFRSDPEAMKKELIQRLSSEGEKVTPVMIEKRLFSIERAASIHSLLTGIEKAGGKVVYIACDATDGEAVSGLVEQIIAAEGRLDYIIHTAGIERSHLLEQKTPQEFRLVFSVKADGIYHLMRAINKHKLSPKGIVTFSSIAGRMGNVGQTDYSAANDLFCKLTSALPRQFPDTKFVAMDWGPWADVGMASRGSMPVIMQAAGIGMVRAAIGAQLVRLELEASGNGAEVVVAGTLGILGEQRDAQGGLDFEGANQALTAGDPAHVMLSRVVGFDLSKGFTLEVELDPKTEPFLIDHAMNGTSLLPGVMGIEGFSFNAMHVASVLGTAGDGFHVTGLEGVKFLAPFKFYKDEPRKLTWLAQVYRINGRFEAHVQLESTRTLKGRPEEKIIHFSGRVCLVRKPADGEDMQVAVPDWNGSRVVLAEDIYKLYFHGPSFQVLEGAQNSGADAVTGKLREKLLPITTWDHNLLTMPLLIELCLQTAGVWEVGTSSVMSLPMSIGKIELHEAVIN
ncbi:MAG: SDR family NAD(P)-dependent oxidoreductase, partial [Anaerolineaceae bacterium]|nr:SDR family NAD(P)-dependent oxidoreductase [Anaerolineaceae bacterium]